MSLLDDVKSKMHGAIEHLKQELKGIRTGRANPSILDGVEIDLYGSKMRLKGAANITAPEARQLVITPFDPNNLQMICKAIEKANLNLQPVVDKSVIRINIPAMDTKARQDMVKQSKERGEKTKITIRNIRRDSNTAVKDAKSSGELPEDAMKKLEKQIQELTDKSCKEVDDLIVAKEKDILEI